MKQRPRFLAASCADPMEEGRKAATSPTQRIGKPSSSAYGWHDLINATASWPWDTTVLGASRIASPRPMFSEPIDFVKNILDNFDRTT